MPKRKKKQTGLKKTDEGKDREIEAGPVSAQANPLDDRIEVKEVPLGGQTILDIGQEQPMMSRESGEAWDYQADPQVLEVLEETEQRNNSDELVEKLRQHTAESPILSGGDVDAAWDYANDSGEETVGGTVATPDQDRVDELGEAVGLVYQDEEPLDTEEKLEKRDRNRWELNPASKE